MSDLPHQQSNDTPPPNSIHNRNTDGEIEYFDTPEEPPETQIVRPNSISIAGSVAGDVYVNTGTVISGAPPESTNRSDYRSFYMESMKRREEFIGKVLVAARKHESITFYMSVAIMLAGGILILVAATLALVKPAGSGTSITLATGIGGLTIGVSGAAFSAKADKARKHLAQQADAMQRELRDERRYTQATELLSGINDADLADQARISLASLILNNSQQESAAQEPQIEQASTQENGGKST